MSSPSESRQEAIQRDKGVSVLFVCLGNICRSTMAHSVFEHLIAQQIQPSRLISRVDSCGTIGIHTGNRADPRTLATLESHGLPPYTHTARQITIQDLVDFDYIVAMDGSNLENVKRLIRQGGGGGGGSRSRSGSVELTGREVEKVHLFGEFGEGEDKDRVVADPYYGGDEGFESVYQQVTRLGQGLLRHIEARAAFSPSAAAEQ